MLGSRAVAWQLPARKWKWRLRGSSFAYARRLREELPRIDAIFASSMCNLAELIALAPREYRGLPTVLYFHENQLEYPVAHIDRRDHHFAFTQLHSAAAADRVLWNSRFNRDSFLDGAEALLAKMPDHRPTWLPEAILAKSEILPVPVDEVSLPRQRSERCHIVWNHRWEFDKGPAALLAAIAELVADDLAFELSVVGQRFSTVPHEFALLKERAGGRLRRWGYVESREEYLRVLASADVALSTAIHEFQGLSVLEAATAGAIPLVPDGLAYREIWPREWRYEEGGLVPALRRRIERRDEWDPAEARRIAAGFSWRQLAPRWAELLARSPQTS